MKNQHKSSAHTEEETGEAGKGITVQPPYEPVKVPFLRRLFKGRQDVFLGLIHQQATLTFEGLEALKGYMQDQNAAAASLVTEKEKAADEARRSGHENSGHLQRLPRPRSRPQADALPAASDVAARCPYRLPEDGVRCGTRPSASCSPQEPSCC